MVSALFFGQGLKADIPHPSSHRCCASRICSGVQKTLTAILYLNAAGLNMIACTGASHRNFMLTPTSLLQLE
jgi:hypothetical protein